MEYKSFTSFTSTIDPGVSYDLRKMSHGRRISLTQMQAPVLAEIGEIESQIATMDGELRRAADAAKIEPCTCNHAPGAPARPAPKGATMTEGDTHVQGSGRCLVVGCECRAPKPDPSIYDFDKFVALMEQKSELVINKLYPVYIRWGVKAIRGLTIDDQPATVDLLLGKAAEALVAEVGREIQRIINLSQEEVLGFKLPSTFGAQTDGQTNDTNAPPANSSNTTGTGTALGSTPTT